VLDFAWNSHTIGNEFVDRVALQIRFTNRFGHFDHVSDTYHVTIGDPFRRAINVTKSMANGSILECKAVFEHYASVTPLAAGTILTAVAVHMVLIAWDEHSVCFHECTRNFPIEYKCQL
jgi:hypothetical protein